MFKEKIFLDCPFCGSGKIEALHMDGFRQYTRGGFRDIKEKYEIQTGCPNCGKSREEVEEALEEGKKDIEKDKRILERLKKQGLLSKGEIKSKIKQEEENVEVK